MAIFSVKQFFEFLVGILPTLVWVSDVFRLAIFPLDALFLLIFVFFFLEINKFCFADHKKEKEKGLYIAYTAVEYIIGLALQLSLLFNIQWPKVAQ